VEAQLYYHEVANADIRPFAHYLYHLDVTQWSHVVQHFNNSWTAQARISAMPSYDSWWYEFLKHGRLSVYRHAGTVAVFSYESLGMLRDSQPWLMKSDFYDSYKTYCQMMGKPAKDRHVFFSYIAPHDSNPYGVRSSRLGDDSRIVYLDKISVLRAKFHSRYSCLHLFSSEDNLARQRELDERVDQAVEASLHPVAPAVNLGWGDFAPNFVGSFPMPAWDAAPPLDAVQPPTTATTSIPQPTIASINSISASPEPLFHIHESNSVSTAMDDSDSTHQPTIAAMTSISASPELLFHTDESSSVSTAMDDSDSSHLHREPPPDSTATSSSSSSQSDPTLPISDHDINVYHIDRDPTLVQLQEVKLMTHNLGRVHLTDSTGSDSSCDTPTADLQVEKSKDLDDYRSVESERETSLTDDEHLMRDGEHNIDQRLQALDDAANALF
jgi:hypothetical protein